MWTIDSWAHQFEAFDLMMSILEKSGVDLILRLHPNLGSKSRRYFLREVRDVKTLAANHPTLKVYWHNDSVNSYDLITSADYVIVERSTIGVEASMLGKPVWVTQASQWDLIADIRQVLEPSGVTTELMKPWSPDPHPAQKFAASWNPDRPPLRMRAAVLAVRNPWRHKLQLLALEWAKWRNSTFTTP
jgi:CDP-glycerol glycerophosphotransferase (TagB/SpsB family)